MPTYNFENIIAWKKAHYFRLLVYSITRSFPNDERFGLTSQFRRAAVSISANIAEGYKKISKADKLRFLNISEGSIEECRDYIILSKDLEYIRNMVPAISNKVMDDLKSLQPGNAIAFGSAFKIPVSIHIQKPDPEPLSNNVNLQDIWYKESNFKYSETQTNYISQDAEFINK